MVKIVDADALNAWVLANQRDEVVVLPPPPPPSTEPQPRGPVGTWALKLNEEFSSLDLAIWNTNWLGAPGTITKPVNSREIGAYDPVQVSVGNGQLNLSALKKRVTAADGNTYEYVSGLINTSGKLEFVYGVFEARLKWPGATTSTVPYNWGAWWLNGHHNSWPDKGENDIIENLAAARWHYHFGSPDINRSGTFPTPNGFSNAFHIYTCLWTASGVSYWIDGMPAGGASFADPNPKYLVLNYGLSSSIGGPLSVPATMSVDYVRVWQ